MTRLRQSRPGENVDALCALFGSTKQAYYQRIKYEFAKRAADDVIVEMCRDLRETCPGVGARKLQRMLRDEFGVECGRDRLFALLDREGMLLRQRHRKPRTTYSGHLLRVYPDLVREVAPMRPNEVWASDITYVRAESGFLYLFLVTDMYSRKIVGWALAADMRACHAVKALKMAIRQKADPKLSTIHHSDRGTQYCSSDYVRVLRKNRILPSMTQGGDPRDNAHAERVNGTIKNEFLKQWDVTRSNANRLVDKAVTAYNDHRPHASIDWLTPSEAHLMEGPIERRWKKYPWYSQQNPGINANFAASP